MLKIWNGISKMGCDHVQLVRTITYVLKRVHPAPLRKPGRFPSLRRKHRIYEVVPDVVPEQVTLNILLRKYVEDLGQPGEIVSLDASEARMLLLTKAAVYASEENIKRFGSIAAEEITFSSRYALTTIGLLSKLVLNLPMNKDEKWILQSWHVRSALRLNNVNVSDKSIIMPQFPISGPDMSINNKEFYAHVLINGREKVPVKCRIQHLSNNPKERKVQMTEIEAQTKQETELLFPADEELREKFHTVKYTIVSDQEKVSKGENNTQL